MTRRRAVITGIGVVSALGVGREPFLQGLQAGRSGIGPLTLFPIEGYRTSLAGQARDFDPARHFSARRLPRLSRADQMGLVAAREAAEEAGLKDCGLPPEELGCALGAGAGGMLSAEEYRLDEIHGREASAARLIPFPCGHTGDLVATELNLLGPRATVVTACSSSATAVGLALDWIRSGRADLVVTGGSEALCRITYSGFNSLRAVDPEPCRPFDRDRQGLNLGEGSAILVLEERERARARGRRGYAEVLGYATTCDAHHMTAPDPEGRGAGRVMQQALEDARVSPERVDYVNAHGTATPHNDAAETAAIRWALGARAEQIPVSSIKSMVGHLLGAAGCVEIAATALGIHHSFVPPTVNHRNPDPRCDLDYVPGDARRQPLEIALSNSFAFGGNNTCVVLGRTEDLP